MYEWFEKIEAQPVDKHKEFILRLKFQATTKQSSFSLLNAYIHTISIQTHREALDNLQAVVDAKRNELIQRERILETQATSQLWLKLNIKYGLDIAKAADVNQPIQINNNEIFSIDLGTKALTAKIKALESVKNLNVVEPRLQQINAKISMLEKIRYPDRSIHFKTFASRRC